MASFISHKYKFILVSTNKCANTSTVKMFYDSKYRNDIISNKQIRHERTFTNKSQIFQSPYEYYDEKGNKRKAYLTLKWYKENYPKEYKEYLKIGMVRNTYDKLVSWWFACKELGYPEGNKCFKDWLLHRKVSNHLKYYEDDEGICVLDRVIRFEHREEDIKKIFIDELGIDDLKVDLNIKNICLKKNNIDLKKIERKHYSYYYDDEMLNLLHSFPGHKKDIDYFNFKFERKEPPGKQPLYAFSMKSKLKK